jgi:hypothetical protein
MPFFITTNTLYNAIQALATRVDLHYVSLTQQIGRLMSEVQTDIDNATTVVTGLLTDLTAQNAAILADITQVQTDLANGVPANTAALDAIVAKVTAVQTGLDSATATLTSAVTPASSATPPAAAPPVNPVNQPSA